MENNLEHMQRTSTPQPPSSSPSPPKSTPSPTPSTQSLTTHSRASQISAESPPEYPQPLQQLPEQAPPRQHRQFSLEITLFTLCLVTKFATNSIITNQLSHQTCTAILRYDSSICLSLEREDKTSYMQQIEEEVHHYVAQIQMVRLAIEHIIPGILCLFIGPWADKYGRRPLIISAFAGYMAQLLVIIMINMTSNFILINPWFYIIGSFPYALSGGIYTIITAIFVMCADNTYEITRESR